VSDGQLSASRTFSWQVTAPDTTAPAVTITSPTTASSYTTSATTLTLGGTASDNVGVTEVQWTNSRGGSGVASGTTGWSAPVALLGGTNVLTVTARDAAGNTAADVLTVSVPTNQPPTLDPVADQTTWIDANVSLQLVGRDADGQTLTYQASGLPAGFELDPSSGLISGSPRGHAGGSHTVTVTVTDGTHSASRSFTWLVLKGGGRKR
jgi:hypothetical protein